jgi:hypothetical protein
VSNQTTNTLAREIVEKFHAAQGWKYRSPQCWFDEMEQLVSSALEARERDVEELYRELEALSAIINRYHTGHVRYDDMMKAVESFRIALAKVRSR